MKGQFRIKCLDCTREQLVVADDVKQAWEILKRDQHWTERVLFYYRGTMPIVAEICHRCTEAHAA